MIVANAHGDQLLEILPMEEHELPAHQPLTHALVVAKSAAGTLLVFNVRKNHWELAGGMIDPGETARQCAHRELREESGQTCADLHFVGAMRFLLRPTVFHRATRTEFGGLYLAQIDRPQPFQENSETSRIAWWDGTSDIGPIDAIDARLATLLE
jgi:8-oxo-dGTP diphosphatase